jgi:hypothetical protein
VVFWLAELLILVCLLSALCSDVAKILGTHSDVLAGNNSDVCVFCNTANNSDYTRVWGQAGNSDIRADWEQVWKCVLFRNSTTQPTRQAFRFANMFLHSTVQSPITAITILKTPKTAPDQAELRKTLFLFNNVT